MAQVKFISCTATQYAGITPDAGTLYFLSDSKTIMKGGDCFSGGVYKQVDTFPEIDIADRNVLYVQKTTGAVKYFDGIDFVTVVMPKATVLSAASTNDETATAKAVVDYVTTALQNLNQGALADRVTAVEKKAADNETAIGVINGAGEGSISKAASDAQAAAEATAAAALTAAKEELQGNIDKKADKATSLEGYGIKDAYTKDETNTAISTAIANAHHLKREIVDQLPEVDAANEDTIYMVPKAKNVAGNAEGNAYTEHMLINGKFEQIGDSTVDLTDYAKTADVNSSIAAAKDEAAADATSKAGNALDSAKKYADGLAVNYATADQGKKADSALQANDVAEGTTDAAIEVKGSAVKVHGLGSAALVNADTFATATQGAKADSALQQADISTGTSNGTVSVRGAEVKVAGLGSAAFKNVVDFDEAGSATAAQGAAKSYTDTEVAAAKEAAATDASNKADNALSAAKSYTDSALTWGTL